MKKLKFFFLLSLICSLCLIIKTPPVSADDDDSGSPAPPPNCPGAVNFNWDEYVDSSVSPGGYLTLKWNENSSYPVSYYRVFWNTSVQNISYCPAGSPSTVCGGTDKFNPAANGNNSKTIGGLTPLQKYNVEIFAYKNTSPGCAQAPQCLPTQGRAGCSAADYYNYEYVIVQQFGLIPNKCGDNKKGHSEMCDGTDFGSLNCSNFNTSSVFYEGANLLQCAPPVAFDPNSCQQITKTNCTTCNSIGAVRIDNGIPNSNPTFVRTSSTASPYSFKCLVDAQRPGAGLGCIILSGYSNSDLGIDSTPFTTKITCTIDPTTPWVGNTAQFNCSIPSSYPVTGATLPAGGAGYKYFVKALYPYDDATNFVKDPSHPDITLQQVKTGCDTHSSFQYRNITVKAADTTQPTVTITEGWQDLSQPAPVALYRTVTVSGHCTDSGSGCNDASVKLKKFDTNPGSACPTDYNLYDLTGAQPTAAKTIWYCAAAKDNLGNIGVSSPYELKPGCRDQCSANRDRACIPHIGDNSGGTDAVSCSPSTVSACLEWQTHAFCSYISSVTSGISCHTTGDFGGCYSDGGAGVGETKGASGYVVDTNNRGINNVRVGYNTVYRGSNIGGSTNTLSNGYFDSFTMKDSLDRVLYDADTTVSITVPQGYRINRTQSVCTAVSYDEDTQQCGQPVDRSISTVDSWTCSVNLPLSGYNNTNYSHCSYPTVKFVLDKTDNTSPTVAFQDLLTTTNMGISTNIAAHAEDAIGIESLVIYVDGGIVKECFANSQTKPTSLNCSLSKIFTQLRTANDPAIIYAIATDAAGNTTRSSDQNLIVNPAPSITCGGGSIDSARATGLVSAPQIDSTSKFGTTGACVIDAKATFVPFKIPSFSDLKSLYYDQSK